MVIEGIYGRGRNDRVLISFDAAVIRGPWPLEGHCLPHADGISCARTDDAAITRPCRYGRRGQNFGAPRRHSPQKGSSPDAHSRPLDGRSSRL